MNIEKAEKRNELNLRQKQKMIYFLYSFLELIKNFLLDLYDFIVLWLKVKPKQDFCLDRVPKAPDYSNYKNAFFGGWMAFDLADQRPANTTNNTNTTRQQHNVKKKNVVHHYFDVDVFYVHPTSYGIFNGTSWNASITDPISNFISYFNMHAQAGAFRNISHPIPLDVDVDENDANADTGANNEQLHIQTHLFAPRYRQLSLSFLKENEKNSNIINDKNYQQAQNIAYLDVSTAFQYYLKYSNRPFILVTHSQGTFRAIQLLIDHIDPYPEIRERFLAGYLLGGRVPVSIFKNELKFIQPSKNATDLGCVIAWDLIPNDFPTRKIVERNKNFNRYIYSNVNLDTKEKILLNENEDEVHSVHSTTTKDQNQQRQQYFMNHSHSSFLSSEELERIKKTRIRKRRQVAAERCIVTCPYTWSSHIPTSGNAPIEEDLVLIRANGNVDEIYQRHKGLPLGIVTNILNQHQPTGKLIFPRGLPANIEGDYLVIPDLKKYTKNLDSPSSSSSDNNNIHNKKDNNPSAIMNKKEDEVPVKVLDKNSKLPKFYTYQIWNTYHIQDFTMFHFNIRNNAQERIRAYYKKYIYHQ